MGKLLLPFPVRKRKFHRADALPAKLLPAGLETGPFFIFCHERTKPILKLLAVIEKIKVFELLCFYGTVSHPYPYLWEFLLNCVDIGITFGLCEMNSHRFLNKGSITADTFDLIHRYQAVLCKNTVCPSLDHTVKVFHGHTVPQRNLCLVAGSHTPLKLPVETAPGLHGFALGPLSSSVV